MEGLKLFKVQDKKIPSFCMVVPAISPEIAVEEFLSLFKGEGHLGHRFIPQHFSKEEKERWLARIGKMTADECIVEEYKVKEELAWTYSFGPDGYTITFMPRRALT